MNKEKQHESAHFTPMMHEYPFVFPKEDDIDLYEFFAAIFVRWRIILAITLTTTILAVCYAFLAPRQFEAVVQVAQAESADI